MEKQTSGVSVDEIVNKSKQWTLEGDCTLLSWMEQISKNLEERATKTTSDLTQLTTKLERTSIALSNATNSLAALQYTQFVENRVHDDDETLANVEEVPDPSSDVVDKSANDPSMYSFLKKNLEMMNSCHEAYTFSYDDSDDDEPATNVVYRSKNPYEARPLPHIYGSNLWKEKWHIGLCDSDTDFSGDENSEQFSESSSETDNSYESTAQTMSEWDSTAWGLNANPAGEQKQFRLPSNDGESYSQSEVSTPTEQRRNRLPIAQPVPEQRYYQHVPRKQDNLFDDIFDVSAQTKPQNIVDPPPPVRQEKIYHESLISNEPPPDDQAAECEPNRRLGAKKTLNLFDDDEFSSFMNQIVETAKNVKAAPPPAEIEQEPPKKVPNLFEDHDDLFSAVGNETFAETKKEVQPRLEEKIFVPSSPPKATARTKIRNLFEDDDDDDDFDKMFAAKQSVINSSTKKTINLFQNDSDIENDDVAIVNVPAKQSLVKEATPVRKVPSLKKGLFDDGEDDEPAVVSTPPKVSLVKEATVKEVSSMKKGLFSDEEDDEPAIVTAPTKVALVKEATVKEVSSMKKGLFSDEEDDEPVIATAPAKVPLVKEATPVREVSSMKKGLFDDEEEDDIFKIKSPNSSTIKSLEREQLFGDEKISEPTEAVVEETMEKESDSGSRKASMVKTDFADLFQDEPPEDIFTPTPSIRKTKVADIFADDFADDFEEFLPKPSKKATTKVEKSPLAAKVDFSDLFQDEPPEDFLPPSAAVKVPKVAELFADDSKEVTPKTSSEDASDPSVDEKSTIAQKSKREQLSSSTGSIQKPIEEEKTFVEETLPQPEVADPEDTLTPSSSVIISEDSSSTSLEKDLSGEVVEKHKQPQPVPSFSNLFSDEPPPDDDFSAEPPIAEKDGAPFSSINLFADVPPDDDDFQVAPPAETKRIHSIFYDDFNETIEATREMRAPSNYIFNDEPPPDDDVQATNEKSQPNVVKEKKGVGKVSKLKKFDLEINVGALLPTAKLPSFKKTEAVPEPVTSPPRTTAVAPTELSSKEVRETRDLPENILPNLNKDRVKLGVKRRPSSRKARQESYRKSLIEEEVAATHSDEDDDPQSSGSDLQKTVLTARQNDLQEEIFSSRSFLSKIPSSSRPLIHEESKRKKDSLNDTPTASNKASSLFENFGDFGSGKLVESMNSSKDSSQPEVSSYSLFHDNDAVVNPFGTPKTTPVRPLPSVETTATAPVLDNPPQPESAPIKEQTSRSANVVKSSKVSSLFGDSDDGSDDLFKETKSMKKPSQQKPPESKPKVEAAAKPMKQSASLFSSDEESETDDIFGKSKLKVASKKIDSVKTKHSSSLFSDLSDDDDDDLFGTSKKKLSSVEKSKAKASKAQPTKAPAPASQQPTTASYNPLSDLLDN